jgi:hypothetical protein
VAFVTSLMLWLKTPNLRSLTLIYGTALLGMLTHYHFSIIVFGIGMGYGVVVLLLRKQWSQGIYLASSGLAAAVTFVFVHPLFFHSFLRQQDQRQPFAWETIPERAIYVVHTIIQFVVPTEVLSLIWWDVLRDHEIAVGAGALLLLILAGVAIWRVQLRSNAVARIVSGSTTTPEAYVPLVIGIAGSGFIIGFYLLHISPQHAIGARYLVCITPLLFIVLAQFGSRFNLQRRAVMGVVTIVFGVQLCSALLDTYWYYQEDRNLDIPAALQDGTPIVLDNVYRGVLPVLLWHVPPATLVYAAPQDELLAHFTMLPDQPDQLSYISDLQYDNTMENRVRILQMLSSAGYCIASIDGTVYGFGNVYELYQAPDPRCVYRFDAESQ